jgi:uncharacterized protein YhbP (UPF0306 family)
MKDNKIYCSSVFGFTIVRNGNTVDYSNNVVDAARAAYVLWKKRLIKKVESNFTYNLISSSWLEVSDKSKGKRLTEIEYGIFGRRITSGSFGDRRHFWKCLREMVVMQEEKKMSEEEAQKIIDFNNNVNHLFIELKSYTQHAKLLYPNSDLGVVVREENDSLSLLKLMIIDQYTGELLKEETFKELYEKEKEIKVSHLAVTKPISSF